LENWSSYREAADKIGESTPVKGDTKLAKSKLPLLKKSKLKLFADAAEYLHRISDHDVPCSRRRCPANER